MKWRTRVLPFPHRPEAPRPPRVTAADAPARGFEKRGVYRTRNLTAGGMVWYAVTSQGVRFAEVELPNEAGPTQLRVVIDWLWGLLDAIDPFGLQVLS